MASGKSPKKISAKAIMQDLKAGLSDKDLMEKYGITFQAVQDVFSQLVKAGLASQDYFHKRSMNQPSRKPPEENESTCPYCGYSEAGEFAKCPNCGQDVSEWLDTVELTKILEGSF